jgi:membrane-bound lytic murein transglycosylase D
MKLFISLFFILLLSGCQAMSTSAPTAVKVPAETNQVQQINTQQLQNEQVNNQDVNSEEINVQQADNEEFNNQEVDNSETYHQANDQELDNEAENSSSEQDEGLTYLVEKETEDDVEVTSDKNYKNLWLKLAENFEFDVPKNDRIAKQRDAYLKNPEFLQQISKRAEPFLWLIVEQIESNDLPLELALFPIVESNFDPYAYSSSGAAGLWQFMPVSGIRFGLKQDWWYDGRRDVAASTRGALQYVQVLHEYLGEDWLYTFAAYNSGEGRIERAINKNKKLGKNVDYWNLDLPKETTEYIPKLLALVDILRNHEKYGVKLPNIPNKKALTYVDVGSQIDLAYAAELSDLSIAEIQLLNPGFKHWATSPNGPHKMLLPNVVAKKFTTNLAQVNKSQRIRWDRYLVKTGDTLNLIAQRKQTTTAVLKQINDLDSSVLKVGQPLLIPIASESQQQSLFQQAQRLEQQASPSSTGNKKVLYTVVEGDTLWDISRRYKVTSKQIAKWNGLTTKHTLQLGQELTIWKQNTSGINVKKKASINSTTYSVRAGDSLDVIAQKFKVNIADLVRWNNIQGSQYIQPGQKIKVYLASNNSNS